MKRLFLAALLALVALAQTPTGSFVKTTTTTGTATAGTIVCVFSNPAAPNGPIHIACTVGTATTLTMDCNPAVGASNGCVGNYTSAPNVITWIITQPTAGTFTYSITPNTAGPNNGTF